jgi:hypothetical protein
MIIKLTNSSGCSFTFNNIPDVNTPKDMKDYLWNDIATNFLFKSREELDNKWEVKICNSQMDDRE